MIWPICQVFLTIGLVASILSFYKQIDKLGQVVFMFIAAVTWPVFGLSLMKITFYAGGSSAMVFWDFTLGGSYTPAGIVWLFGGLGIIYLIIGIIRALELTYQPVIDQTRNLMGEPDTGAQQDIMMD